jgi:hypothetical protein
MAFRLPALAVAAALVLAGCGSGAKVDTEQIRNVVEQFALADDARACDLLSNHALIGLSGDYKRPAPEARRICVERSKDFEGERVRVGEVNVIDDGRVRVTAESLDGKITFGVSLRRYGSDWRIESISQAREDD